MIGMQRWSLVEIEICETIPNRFSLNATNASFGSSSFARSDRCCSTVDIYCKRYNIQNTEYEYATGWLGPTTNLRSESMGDHNGCPSPPVFFPDPSVPLVPLVIPVNSLSTSPETPVYAEEGAVLAFVATLSTLLPLLSSPIPTNGGSSNPGESFSSTRSSSRSRMIDLSSILPNVTPCLDVLPLASRFVLEAV